MSDLTPEQKTEQITLILRECFRQWNNVLETRGEPGDPQSTIITEYAFVVDRRQEEESLVTADSVYIRKYAEPLGELLDTRPESIEAVADKEWLIFAITPKDPYRPKLGIYTLGATNFYYSETLELYLSSHGRAYQSVEWGELLKPDIHQDQIAHISYLRRYPKPEEIQIRFHQEPVEVYTEPFQPLKGGSLERLDFLMSKLNSGQTIDNQSS